MLRFTGDIIRAIEELQKIPDELSLMDYLKKEFPLEYGKIFQEEMEEQIRISKSNYWEDFDIRKYSLYLFKGEISTRYGINGYYGWLDILKIIIFYENILTLLDKSKPENVSKNQKIQESRNVYDFFKDLASGQICTIAKHANAIKVLNLTKLSQTELNNDIYHALHDFFARKVLEKYLEPFVLEYLEMVKRA